MDYQKPKEFNQEEFESWKAKGNVEMEPQKKGDILTYLFEVPIWLITFVMQDMWGRGSGMGELMDDSIDTQSTLHWQSFVLFFGLLVGGIILYFVIKNYG